MSEQDVRLATLAGCTLDEAKEHNRRAREQTPTLLKGSIDAAWKRCLPAWRELGRVCDLSKGVRVPKYFATFQTQLGAAFVQKFPDATEFLVKVLRKSPIASTEYLCAFDLLEMLVHEMVYDILPGDEESRQAELLHEAFDIDLPVPPIVVLECDTDEYVDHTATIGGLLRRVIELEYM